MFYKVTVNSDFETSYFNFKNKPTNDQLISILLTTSIPAMQYECPENYSSLKLSLTFPYSQPHLKYWIESYNTWDFYIQKVEKQSYEVQSGIEKFLTDQNSKIRKIVKERLGL